MEDILRQAVGVLRSMWRFRWWGLALTWVVGAAAAVVIYTMPDRYESTARVYVDTQSVLRPLMSGLAVQPNLDQQIAILSRTLITRPNVEKLINMADLNLEVTSGPQREQLVGELMSGLRIGGTGRDNLFTLAYRDGDPKRAQRVVQALMSLFVESGLVSKRQDTDTARRFIEEQIRNYEEKLTAAENRLKDFRLRNMALLDAGGRDYVGQLAAVSAQLEQARLELREAINSRDATQRQLQGEDPVLLPQMPNAAGVSIPEIDGRIDAMRKTLDALLQRYTESHPDVIGTRRVIEDLEAQKLKEIEMRREAGPGQFGSLNANPVYQQLKLVLSETEARIASLQARVGSHEARLAELRASAELLPKIDAELAQLNRDYDVHKRNYETLVQRRESANISVEMGATSGIAEFRVIDPPSLPLKPAAPNRALLMLAASVAAIGAGAALTFLISQLRPSFADGRSLREVTGLPVLGTVSLLGDPRREASERRGRYAFAGGVAGYAGAVAVVTAALKMLQG
ncbi:XrtA system polysaccharide chain length determinant [Pseudothauera rhizosphaerae]|uniref:Chain length-determining protein n=1 Tax=Pseudothauera rhizosphaerae TaxID=2565932 RepID=A0A4S4ASX2_9RHOO|nr:XrtA system polysaccharide chain length determinant [Pseudothauera rhizosphaerae]THF61639.1 chain length-determining protein [Pseudothauera rhizosphaerae]